jgi:hypothetical protein
VGFYFGSLSNRYIQRWIDCFGFIQRKTGINIILFFEVKIHYEQFNRFVFGDLELVCLEDSFMEFTWLNPKTAKNVKEVYGSELLRRFRSHALKGMSMKVIPGLKERKICGVVNKIDTYLRKYRPDLIFVMEPKGISWTANIFLLEQVCQKRGIPMKFIHVMASFTRLGIFDNFYRVSEEVIGRYRENIATPLPSKEKERVLEFFTNYRRKMSSEKIVSILNKVKKEEFSTDILRTTKGTLSRKRGWPYQITAKIKDLAKGKKSSNYSDFDISKEKYVLFLPNKPNNGRANYFAPEAYNKEEEIIQHIAKHLPPNYSLVIKAHPHARESWKHGRTFRATKELDNCFHVDPKLSALDFIARAELIIVTASTALFDSMMCFKHVIAFCNKVPVLGRASGPLVRINSLKDLEASITYCLHNESPKEEIISFFHAVLSCSYAWGHHSDTCWADISARGFESKVDELIQKAVFQSVGQR